MKKTLSMLLVLSMIFTMLPISLMAEEANDPIDARGEIIAFASITETERSVTTGTSIEDLELPEYLTATVRTTYAMQEDANQQTVADKVYSSEWEESMIDAPVTWTAKPEYDMDTVGDYVFTPVIEGHTVSAELPEIKVMVEAEGAMPLTIMPQTVGGIFVAPITIGDKTDVSWEFIILTESDGDTRGTVEIYSPDSGKEQQYTGDLIIPETVTNGGKTYDVTEIGGVAFNSCKMSKVFIPKTIGGSIGGGVFSGASNLVAINVDPNNTSFISEDGVLYNKNKTTLIKYPQAKTGETFAIPESVDTLSVCAFNGCKNILSIDIPENITKIGDSHLFSGCSALEEVTIPSGVSDIPHATFYNCIALQLITFNRMTAPTLSNSAFGSYPDAGYFPKDLKVKIPAASSGYIGEAASEAWKALADKLEPIPVTSYKVWVGGTQVTSANASDVLSDGKVSYNASTNILTLTDADITTAYEFDFNPFSKGMSGIYVKGDLNLVLVGSSNIGGSSFDTTGAVSAGIFVSEGDLNISGAGSLTATAGKAEYDSTGVDIESFNKCLTISGGANVTAIGGTGFNSRGVFINGSLMIDGGSLTAMGDSTGESSQSFGAYGGYINSSFTIKNGGSLTAVGGNAKYTSGGAYFSNTTNNIIVDDGNLATSAGEAANASTGIKGDTISIRGGTVTASAQKRAINVALTFDSGYVHKNTAGSNADGSGATVLNDSTLASGIADYKYIKIEPATALTGTATINNTTPKIGDVLNGSLDGGNNTGVLTYVWKADGTQVSTGTSYMVTIADLGKKITLEISSNVEIGTIKSAATEAVLKKVAPPAPEAPTLVSKTHNSIILTAKVGYQFSKDGTTWQTNNVFSGLTASAAYTFYQRVAETTDTEASVASMGLSVTTNSSYTGDSGSSGSGGGRSSDKDKSSDSSKSPTDNSSHVIVTPPAPDKPDSPTQGEIKVDGKVDESGNATVNITDKNVTDVFDKALADAKKNGNEQNGITLVLRVNTGGKYVSNVTVNLPKTVQNIIISKRIVNTIVVVDNPDIKISMDLPTVEEINRQANSDVNVTAARGDSGKLTGNAKRAIGNRPVFDLKVNYGSGKQVQSFGAGSISVTIPYILGINEKAENVCAIYIDVNGKVHWLVSSVYDNMEKVLRFSTDHFSTYGIGYKQIDTVFTDIASHWAKEDIEFVANRGLLRGTSETTFSPSTAMTRGIFITALGRLANADVSIYKQSSFSDVKAESDYMGYIEWARKNGIVSGTTDGKFLPDASITREQMSVIMSNYAKNIGYTLPKIHMENIFVDSDKISTYAKDAVEQMQLAGILNGKNGNLFDPQGAATRAEISAVLRRFIELAISSDTM